VAPLFVVLLVQQRRAEQIGHAADARHPCRHGRAGHHQQRRPGEHQRVQPGTARLRQPGITIIADIHVRLEPDQVGGPIGGAQFHLETRCGLFKGGDLGREPLRGKAGHAPQAQIVNLALGHDFPGGRHHIEHRRRNPRVIGLPRFGQRQPAALAIDQHDPEPFLQRFQMATDHGVIEPQQRRRAAHAAHAANHLERAQGGKRRDRLARQKIAGWRIFAVPAFRHHTPHDPVRSHHNTKDLVRQMHHPCREHLSTPQPCPSCAVDGIAITGD
jgi:hypothetical protein